MARIKQNKLNQIKGYSEYKSRRDGEEEEKSSSVASSGSSVTSGSRIKKSKLEGINHYVPASDEDRQKRQLEVVKEDQQRRQLRLRELKTQIDAYDSASRELSDIMLDANGLAENPDRIRELSRQVTELGKTIDDVKKEYEVLSDDPDIRNATLKDMTVNALKRGYYNSNYGEESYDAMMGDDSNEKQKYADILAGDDYQYENTEWWQKWIGGGLEQVGQWAAQVDEKAVAAAGAGAASAWLLGKAGPQAAIPEEFLSVPGMAVKGLRTGMAYNAYKSEAGHAYNTMRELGVSEDTARAVAIAIGVGVAALESDQLAQVVKGFKVLDATGADDTLMKRLGKELLAKGIDVAKETGQEVLQEGLAIGGESLASKYDTGKWAYTWDEAGERLKDTAIDSALAFSALNVPATAKNFYQTGRDYQAGSAIKDMGDDTVQAIIEEGLATPEDSDAHKKALELKQKLDNGGQVTPLEVTDMYRQNIKDVRQEAPAEAQDPLEAAAREVVARENEAAQAASQAGQRAPVNVMANNNPTVQQRKTLEQIVKAKTGYGEEGVKSFVNLMEQNNDGNIDKLRSRFQVAYETGLTDAPAKMMKFDNGVQEAAFQAGKRDFALSQKKQPVQAKVNAKAGFVANDMSTDNLPDGVKPAALPQDVTPMQVKILDQLGKMTGVRVRMVDGLDGENARISGSDVLISADFSRVRNGKKVTVVAHGLHEIGMHRLMQLAPGDGRAFINSVIQYKNEGLPANALTVSERRRDSYAAQGVDLDTEGAMEEIAADDVWDLFGDDEAVADFLQKVESGKDEQAKKGARKFMDIMRDLVQKVRNLVAKLTGREKAEAKQVLTDLEDRLALYEKAFKAAVENRKGIENRAGQEYNGGENRQYALKDLDDRERSAAWAYKAGDSYRINGLLLAGMELDGYYAEMRDALDSALEKLPVHRGTVYRNLGFDDFGGKEDQDAFVAQHQVGVPIRYGAYASSSTTPDGHPIEGEYIVNLEIESVYGRDMEGVGDNFEKEVLFGRNAWFVPTEITVGADGHPLIRMQEVTRNENRLHEGAVEGHRGGDQSIRQRNAASDAEDSEMRNLQKVRKGNGADLRGVSEGYSERVSGRDGGLPEVSEVKYSLVTDEETLDFLDNQKLVKVYRAMQEIDGKLYPPMAALIKGDTGKKQLVEATEKGKWYQADEHPELIKLDKSGKPKFELNKGNGAMVPAAYNPYFHTSMTPLNDQFSSAYDRPNIVVVEGYIPSSELTSGYKAQYAKDSVGETTWHAGPVASKLKGAKARRVYLSRWFKADRVVPTNEVAKTIAETLKGENLSVPWNVVTPELRKALEKQGVSIDYKDIKMGSKVVTFESTQPKFSLKDSEGNELTREQQEYFADSKIRDKKGNLQVVYHGTQNEFYVFDTSVSGGKNGTAEGYGIYTSDDPEVTSAYGDRQIKMYANITKPATSNKKTITAAKLSALIKDTCKRQAQQMVADGEYDSVKDALMDTWISNYVYTYDLGMERSYREAAGEILRMNDNDMAIVQEVMSGMGIRDYSDASDFYRNSLTPVTGFDGFVTEWKNENTGKKSKVILAFESDQLKEVSNKTPTSDPDIRYSLKDEDYMKAVNAGDMETAQKMADEAAAAAGYHGAYYHGSKNNFTVFSKAVGGKSNSDASVGFWFTETAEGAQKWTEDVWYGDNDKGKVYKTYLDLKNPKVYETVDNSDALSKVYDKYDDIDIEMTLYDSIYCFEDGRRYHSERYDYDSDKRRRSGINEWDAFKAIVKKYDADTVEWYLDKVPEGDREIVKRDAERYLELHKARKALDKERAELRYSDGYELFRTDIYKLAGMSAEQANIGGTGMYMDNKKDVLKQYVDGLKAQGHDGIIIKNTSYDSDTFGNGNNQYVVFESEQIKSADPVTYDDNGKVIPLSERFKKDNPDIRYSLKDSEGRQLSQQQQDFFKDSKVRDENGNLLVMYHGTPNAGFTEFRSGSYFTQHKEWADVYQSPSASSISAGKALTNPDTYAVYLNIKKPFDTRNPKERRIFQEEFYRKWGTGTPLADSGLPDWIDGMDLQEFIEENGYDYDGLILDEGAVGGYGEEVVSRGLSYVTFSPEQVKNIDNKAPTDDPDIRYSLKEQEDILAENAKLKEVNAALREQFQVTKFAKVDRKSLEKFAKQLLKDYSSGADINDTRDALDGLYTYMANGIDGQSAVWEEAYQMAYDVALEVLNNAVTLDDSLWQAYKPLRDHLRKVKITLAKEDWGDLEAYGGYNEFRKANMGRLNLVKDGVPVDVAYQEMAYLWPEYFNEEEHTHPADQLAHMAEVLDGLQPIESNPYAVGMRESATWLANDIMERFFELPQAKPTFADKAERKLTQQVIKDRKKLEALREQKDQKIAKIIKQQREKTAERIKKEKADKWKKAAEVKEHYQTKEKRMSESRKARVMRAKIMRHASELQHKLLRPTDKQHVPESLRKPVAALLDAINLESGFEWEYGKDGAYHRVKRGSSPTADTTNRTKAFLKVRQAYEKILKDGAEYDGAADLVVDPDSLAIFDQVLEMRDVPIAEMTAKELQTIWDAVRLMEHSVSTAGKMLSESKHKTTAAMAEAFQEDTASRKDVKSSPVLNQLKQDLKTPYTFFSNYGQAGLDFFQVLLNAQSHEQTMQNEIAAKVSALVSKEKREALEKETVQFNGMTFSKAHVMGLYLLSKREQAVQHMTHGGIVQPEIGKIKRGVEPRMVPEMNLVQIQELLTAEERKLADEFQKLTLQLAEWGNQAAMKAYGYRKFTDPHYWPIRSASEQVNQTVEKNRDNARSIANMGSAKALNPNATNGLEVESIFETFDRHASDMMTYSAWLIPMEDANRLFNFKFKDEDGNLTGRNMQTLLNKVGGPASTKYWLELMKDIQNGIGGANDTGLARLSNKIIGNVKKASVAGNLRVVVQQPTAMMRAAAVLKPENLARFAKAPTKGSGWEKAVKYAPIAARKATGGFEVSANPKQLAEIMYKPETKKGKAIQGLKDAPMWAPGKADEMTWGFIWNACEWQVAEDKSLDKGSESFYKATAKLFEEVIVQTQVVDGVLQRSQAMRSSNGAVKQMTSFMGEPTQTLNMVMRAYDNFRNETDPGKRTSARKKLATAATAVVFNGVLNAMAQSIIDATRDDDEEKEYLERYMTALTGLKGDEDTLTEFAKAIFLDGNLGSNLNPANWVYYLSDVVSLLQGYSIERMDASAFGDFLTAASNMEKAIAGESKWTPAYAAAKLLTTAGKLFGSSSANIMRDVESLLRTVLIAGDNWEGLYESDKMKYDLVNQKNYFLDFAYQAYAAGNTEAYEAIVEDMAKNGVDRDAIKSGMESRMKKAQGVNKVEDLTERYLFPDQEVEYDRTMSRIKSSSVWKNASGAHKDKVEDKLYEIVTGSKAGMELQEKITEGGKYGIDETEYLLYTLALDMHDKANENGKYGTYTNQERAEAILGMGLKDNEMAYLWDKEEGYEALAAGVRMEKYIQFKADLDGIKATKNALGKVIVSREDKIIQYLNKLGVTNQEKRWLLGTVYDKYK